MWVTIGGELHLRSESIDHPDLGLRDAQGYTTGDVRGLLEADLRTSVGPRAFVQFSVAGETGRRPAPRSFDRSGPDLAQAFVDLPMTTHGVSVKLRLGRQELDLGPNRLVSSREAANLRRAFDMETLIVDYGTNRVTIFNGRPVQNRDNAFDDRADPNEHFSGGDLHVQPSRQSALDIFGFNRSRARATYAIGIASEKRTTIGGRLAWRASEWDVASQVAYQCGSFAEKRISAEGLSLEGGRQWPAIRTEPRIGLILGYASGDRHTADGRLNTFDPVYPNLSYFSDAPVFYPANTWDLQPNLSISPRRGVTLTVGADFVQRIHGSDSIYTPPGVPLMPSNVGMAGHAVTLAFTKMTWRMNPHLSADASFVRGLAGRALATPLTHNFYYGLVEITSRY